MEQNESNLADLNISEIKLSVDDEKDKMNVVKQGKQDAAVAEENKPASDSEQKSVNNGQPSEAAAEENKTTSDSEQKSVNNGQSSEADIEKSNKIKNQANALFKDSRFDASIELYSQAITLNPTEKTLYTNRSLAYFRTECFGAALADANKAIEINRNFHKAYYRRAITLMAMTRFKEALKDFELLSRSQPGNEEYRTKVQECSKIVKRIAFERAIAGNDDRSVAEQIDVESMAVEPDYNGPALEDGKRVTAAFMQQLIEHFREQKLLHRKFAYEIILQASQLFKAQPSLVDINVPDGSKFTVCGDIHGQFYDLLNIFKLNGLPSETNPYLFNGDFVDRGSFSLECILTLFGFKVLYPQHFFLSRGNHESHSMNQIYGFAEEIKVKYSYLMYELFAEVFNQLPLCHCLNSSENSRVLVMHGGLFSEDNITLDDIRKIDRFRQPPNDGLMCELLWSDPMEANGRAPSQRGVGCRFGPDVTEAFCKANKLDYVIRSHEAMQMGYQKMHNNKCITVFSAPNYCDTLKNKGAFIILQGSAFKDPEIVTFSEVEHPKVRSYMNASMFY